MEKHNWYAVITAKVLLDKNLTETQKLLIALISNLSNEKGFCFASNKYLGDQLNKSAVTIQQNIAQLEEMGYLNRVIELDSKGELKYRALTILETIPPHIKDNTPPPP